MRLPRTSIAALMGCVLILALAFEAILRPTPLWAAAAFSGILLALTCAIVLALYARGLRRAFWTGFLVGGSSYLFLQAGPYCNTHVGPHTLPTAALDLLYGALTFPQEAPVTFPHQFREPNLSSRASPPAAVPHPQVVDMLDERLASVRIPFPAQSNQDLWRLWTGVDSSGPLPVADTSPEFYRIGHSFLGFLVASAFGVIARRLAERNTERVDGTAA